MSGITMLTGFGNYHQTQAVNGALPLNQNSPQHPPQGLFAEQISGTAFTVPRKDNKFSWLYRTHPSVVRPDYSLHKSTINFTLASPQPPNAMRWSEIIREDSMTCFWDGLFFISGNSAGQCYQYHCDKSSENAYLQNNDGELLFVPYKGQLCLHTELGQLVIKPGEIAVVPRGIVFKIQLLDGAISGYLCENLGALFQLPELGPIGANGLANPRHFEYPLAAFETTSGPHNIICKYQHHFWKATQTHSPLNVVAWHGNYAPYKYDLSLFNTINTVSFDHPDPSIFTVLTSQSTERHVPNIDFVIFPERWMVAENTFRPPYFHKNVMSEFMGLIHGQYDAKGDSFGPGGFSIHNCMEAHGPDTSSFKKATKSTLTPERYTDTLAFMFESRQPWNISQQAFDCTQREINYRECWKGLTIGK